MPMPALPGSPPPLGLRLLRWLLALPRQPRPARPPLALPWPLGEDVHGGSELERELLERERRWR